MKKKALKMFNFSRQIPKTSKFSSVPGTVQYIGIKRSRPISIDTLDYSKDKFKEYSVQSISEISTLNDQSSVKWININGVHQESIIKDTGKALNIHPLILEDIANTTQRPKVEEHQDFLFLIVKMAYIEKKSKELIFEQVSILLGKNYLITLQEREGDVLEGVRERIRSNKGKIRKESSDYLLYAILDAIVDNYFSVLEQLGEQIEDLEVELIENANQSLLHQIHHLKQELIFLRKSIWPMREVVNTLQRMENPLMSESSYVYFRDVYDHTIQVMETVETFRDMSNGMLDLYLSTVSNKMNEVMKVLTIFAAIFIPLTFIAGVYGMNFDVMPELKWKFAYAVWWGIIIVITAGMLLFFKKKKWL